MAVRYITYLPLTVMLRSTDVERLTSDTLTNTFTDVIPAGRAWTRTMSPLFLMSSCTVEGSECEERGIVC